MGIPQAAAARIRAAVPMPSDVRRPARRARPSDLLAHEQASPARETRHPVRRAAGRGAFWVLRAAVVAAAAIAVAPVTLVAVGAAGFAWWRGWTPRRLYEGAAWCLPMAVSWLIAVVVWPVQVTRRRARPQAARCHRGLGRGRCGSGWSPRRTGCGRGCGSFSAHGQVAGGGGRGRAGRGAGRDRGRRAWLGLPALPDAERGGRAHPGRARSVRRAPVAAPGQVRAGGDRGPGRAAAAVGQRAGGGGRDDPFRPASDRANGGDPVPAAAFASGGHRVDRDREDHPAAAALGRLHGRRRCAATPPGPGGGRCWSCSTARAGRPRARSPTGPAGCCATPARARPRSGRTRRRSRSGRCRLTGW